MGRPSKLSPEQWREIERLIGWPQGANFLKDFVDSKDNEHCICRVLEMMLATSCGDVERMLHVPPIERYAFEYAVYRGSIDLVLFHAHEAVSLVEVKSDKPAHEMFRGIGQLFYYEAMYRSDPLNGAEPNKITKILVAPVSGEVATKADEACVSAGVRFVRFAPFSLIDKHREELQKWAENLA